MPGKELPMQEPPPFLKLSSARREYSNEITFVFSA